MPRATVTTDTERFELKSLPEGFVELRKIPWGAFLRRQDIMMKMSIAEAEAEARGGRGGQADMQMSMGSFEASHYMFVQSVVDHNLEDENGRKLDLRKQSDFRRLDPAVGQEIDELIDAFNGEVSQENLEN